MKTHFPSFSLQCFLLVVWLLCFNSPASALDLGKPFKKATNWVAVRSGLKPTGDNLNNASTSTAAAAQQATVTGKEAEVAIQELKPKASAGLESITRGNDAAGTILIWVKWPMVVSIYCLALWLPSLALRSWRQLSTEGRGLTTEETVPAKPITFSGRIFLISLGFIAFSGIISLTQV